MEQFKGGNIEDEDFRRMVIDLFVNSVTVWDELNDYFKITIACNLTSLPTKTYRLQKGGTFLSDLERTAPQKVGGNGFSASVSLILVETRHFLFLASYTPVLAWLSAASVIHPDEAESLRGGRVACGSAVPGLQNRRHFLRAALSKAHLQKRAA
ncbi:hypothetical protein EI53_00114 [Fusobacterium naviforme]|nr:hypothetical protein EI53_00114 [Fusobacterium naviforme]STO28463.1 Uncharacterised protein [Fusobacterium naviforme]